MKKVSVIITTYNNERFLSECLESIINQTMTDIEIICIDGGSADSTWDILGDYEKRDSRVRRIRQEYQNAGVARNFAMESADGEYLFFSDADAFYGPGLLNSTYLCGKELQADVVVFGGREYNQQTGAFSGSDKFLNTKYLPKKRVFDFRDVSDKTLRFTNRFLGNKMFRREYIQSENIAFPQMEDSEDVYFVSFALLLAQRITCINQSLAYFRTYDGHGRKSDPDHPPMGFADCVTKLYDVLFCHGLLPEAEKAFYEIAIALCGSAVRKAYRRDARLEICQRLNRDDILALRFEDRPINESTKQDDLRLIIGSRYAVSFDKRYNRKNRNEPLILIPSTDPHKPLVSIIVPVYNVEPYLRDCLDSLTGQTLSEIEIICVNDGSTDNSLQILQEYAEKDKRITVLTQENEGLSRARNIGVSVARAEYICFVDSDDCLVTSALEELYQRATADKLDILLFGATMLIDSQDGEIVSETARTEEYIRSREYSGVYSGAELAAQLMDNQDYYESACLQLTRREFWVSANLSFSEGLLHEDVYYTFRALLCAERVGCENREFYTRRIRPDSIMTKKLTFHHVYGYFHAFMQMDLFYREQLANHPEWDSFACFSRMIRIVYQGFMTRYLNLSIEERCFRFGLPQHEYEALEFLLSDYLALQQTKRELQEEKKRLRNLKESASFRLGCILTWPLRKLRILLTRISK